MYFSMRFLSHDKKRKGIGKFNYMKVDYKETNATGNKVMSVLFFLNVLNVWIVLEYVNK